MFHLIISNNHPLGGWHLTIVHKHVQSVFPGLAFQDLQRLNASQTSFANKLAGYSVFSAALAVGGEAGTPDIHRQTDKH